MAETESAETEIVLCSNGQCGRLVPPSKNPGVKRIYCSPRCARSVASRRYYERETGRGDSSYLVKTNAQGEQYVSRQMPMNPEAARNRFHKHITSPCPLAKDERGKCPGHFDAYDTRHLCIIRAVLREDWEEIRKKAVYVEWERLETTSTGFWKHNNVRTNLYMKEVPDP